MAVVGATSLAALLAWLALVAPIHAGHFLNEWAVQVTPGEDADSRAAAAAAELGCVVKGKNEKNKHSLESDEKMFHFICFVQLKSSTTPTYSHTITCPRGRWTLTTKPTRPSRATRTLNGQSSKR
jgi:hypothetical protein